MTEIHRFIRSMTASEKKYFRRYGLKDDTKGQNISRTLFDLLDEMEEWDGEKLNIRLKRLKLEKQVQAAKSYLMQLLTESMVWYNRESYEGFNHAFEMARIQLLNERGLTEDADKAEEKWALHAINNGSFAERWQALGYRIHETSNSYLSNRKQDAETMLNLLQERATLLEAMQQYHAYDILLSRQLQLMKKAMIMRTSEDISELERIFQNPLLHPSQPAVSPEAKFLYRTIRIQHFTITGNMLALLDETASLVAEVNAGALGSLSTMRILWAYQQRAQVCYFTQNWNELEVTLQQLYEVKTNSPVESAAKFTYHTQLTITLLDHRKQTSALLQLLKETAEKLRTFKEELRHDVRLAITITCASALVEYKSFNDAIDVCEHFLSNYETGIRLDALLMLYTYQFVAHMESGNVVYVNNVLQNFSRYLQRHQYKGDFENALLKCLRVLSETGLQGLTKAEAQKLSNELTNAAQSNTNPHMQQLVPFINNYLQQKVKGTDSKR